MTAIQWYQKAFTNYVSMEGRSTRSEYWYFQLGNFLIQIAILILVHALHSRGVFLLFHLWALITFLPSLGVTIRRLHDTDKSAWNLLLLFIPFVGPFIFLYFMIKESDMQTNRYGSPEFVTLPIQTL